MQYLKNFQQPSAVHASSCGCGHAGCAAAFPRRDFLKAAGSVATAASFFSLETAAADAGSGRTTALVRGAFAYPPTSSLDEAGY